MSDLLIPPTADEQQARDLITTHLEVGDEVKVWNDERTEASSVLAEGEITDFASGYLEIDGESLTGGSVRYDEMRTVTRLADR